MIILNYNSAEDTVICVNQLIGFGADFHIIVVDNCSSDRSISILHDHFDSTKNVTILRAEKNGGYSAGNNLGIKYAIKTFKSNFIGIVNPDVIIPDLKVIYRMITVLKHSTNIAVVGASAIDADGIYNPNNSGWNIPSGTQLVMNHFLLNKRKLTSVCWNIIGEYVAKVDCVAGCFFIAKADALNQVGFLDEKVFLYNEENILGIKLKKAGYTEGIVLDQFYYHNHRRNNSYIPFCKKVLSTKSSYLSRVYLCKLNYSRVLIPFLFLAEMMNRIYLAICYLKGKIKEAQLK